MIRLPELRHPVWPRRVSCTRRVRGIDIPYVPMTPEELAYLMLVEYRCENCHQTYGTEIFDRLFVCSPCRKILEEKLVKNG